MKRIGPGALVGCSAVLAYLPSLPGRFIWNDSDYVTAPALRFAPGPGAHLDGARGDAAVLPLPAQRVLGAAPDVWRPPASAIMSLTVLLHAASAVLFALCPSQALPATCGGRRGWPGWRRCFRAAPGERRVGGLDLRAEEHPLARVLPRRGPGLPPLRRDAAAHDYVRRSCCSCCRSCARR